MALWWRAHCWWVIIYTRVQEKPWIQKRIGEKNRKKTLFAVMRGGERPSRSHRDWQICHNICRRQMWAFNEINYCLHSVPCCKVPAVDKNCGIKTVCAKVTVVVRVCREKGGSWKGVVALTIKTTWAMVAVTAVSFVSRTRMSSASYKWAPIQCRVIYCYCLLLYSSFYLLLQLEKNKRTQYKRCWR